MLYYIMLYYIILYYIIYYIVLYYIGSVLPGTPTHGPSIRAKHLELGLCGRIVKEEILRLHVAMGEPHKAEAASKRDNLRFAATLYI